MMNKIGDLFKQQTNVAEHFERCIRDRLVIKGGAMANYVMDVEGVKQLASMPSREELLAKLMATMNEPVAKLVRTINEVPARFVRNVAAYRDAQEKAAA